MATTKQYVGSHPILITAALLTAAIAVFTFVQNRTKVRLEEEIAHLDKQIKQLELIEKRDDHNNRV